MTMLTSFIRSRISVPVAAVLAFAACTQTGFAAAAAGAADYPHKTIRLVAPAAPGGGIDIAARITAQRLLAGFPQPVIVDNRGGSGGIIGTELVAKAPPDGYTLLMNGLGGTYLKAVYAKLSFDPESDFAAVALVVRQPWALAVHPALPVASTADFIRLAKSKPGELRYGTGGVGSASFMGLQLLRSAAQIDIAHVPYKGTGPALLALLGGEIQFLIASLPSIAPHASTGRARLLGVTTAARTRLMPALPTIGESGLPGYTFDVWYGLFAPVKTPRAVINRLNAEINRSVQQPDLSERLAAEGLETAAGTPQQFEAHFRSEITKWKKVVLESGMRAE